MRAIRIYTQRTSGQAAARLRLSPYNTPLNQVVRYRHVQIWHDTSPYYHTRWNERYTWRTFSTNPEVNAKTDAKDASNEDPQKKVGGRRSEKDTVDQYWKRETKTSKQEEQKVMPIKAIPQRKNTIDRVVDNIVAFGDGVVAFLIGVMKCFTQPAQTWESIKYGWSHFVTDLKSYWVGTKLLAKDVATCARLLRKITKGKDLTRRERRQLKRTTVDVFRLVPFAAFIVIPFMEILLPVALKLFPSMLPSTFKSEKSKSDLLKRELKARLAYAEFLQETTADMAESFKHEQKGDVELLLGVIKEAREGKRIPNKRIIALAGLFKDELMLENLPRSKLIMMCKYMNIRFHNGPTEYLRFALAQRIRDLKRDDKMIMREGVESLTLAEMQTANRDRGMRSTGLTKLGYERNLQQWLDLSVNPEVPFSLLILSRAFAISETRPVAAESVMNVIQSLDQDTIDEVALDLGMEDNVKKAEILDKVNKKIEAEAVATSKAEEARKDEAQELKARIEKDLGTLAQEITDMASTSAVERERKTLKKLQKVKDQQEKEELLEQELDASLEEEDPTAFETKKKKTKGMKYVQKSMDGMIQKLSQQLDAVDEQIGDELNIIDLDHDGLVSIDELEMVLREKQMLQTDEEIELLVTSLQKLCKRKSMRFLHLDDVREIATKLQRKDNSDEELELDDYPNEAPTPTKEPSALKTIVVDSNK